MADFDSKLPIRAAVTDVIVQVADSGSVTIDPAKEGGNLATIKTNTDNLDVLLSTRATEATVATLATEATAATLATEATVATLATEVTAAAILADTATIDSQTATMAAWDASGRAKVTIQTDATVDLNKVAGTATDVNTGNASNGTQRVVLATDQPAVPVTFTPADLANTNVYSTATVAAANSNTQTYSPASTVYLTDIYASASGQMKVELQFGTTGGETTFAVLFTSKGNLIAHFHLDEAMKILNTQSVKVIRTNTDNQSMDVYSTICVHA